MSTPNATAPPAVIYAARSAAEEDDDRASTTSQLQAVRTRLGREPLAEFAESGYSGSKGNRGPKLQAAIDAAVAAAAGHGHAELWAFHSSRFGRGSGKLGEARALGGLFYDLRSRGVSLRTVEDDEFVTNEQLIGIASSQAAKYADDLSAHVRRGLRAKAMRGEWMAAGSGSTATPRFASSTAPGASPSSGSRILPQAHLGVDLVDGARRQEHPGNPAGVLDARVPYRTRPEGSPAAAVRREPARAVARQPRLRRARRLPRRGPAQSRELAAVHRAGGLLPGPRRAPRPSERDQAAPGSSDRRLLARGARRRATADVGCASAHPARRAPIGSARAATSASRTATITATAASGAR